MFGLRLFVLSNVLLLWAGLASAQNALIFTETAAYQHPVIDDAYNALVANAGIWTLTRTDDSTGYFTPESLATFDVVVFLITSGGDKGLLDDSEKAAFEDYIRGGGGFVGVHSAVGTYQKTWPWYQKLVGATFRGHPKPTQATVRVEDHSHESMRHLPHRWTVTDEWFNFQFAYESPVRQSLHVLATVDESTYEGGINGADHPIIWCHNYEGGRSWYNALGHTTEMWQDPDFVKSVVDGLAWAAGIGKGDANSAHDIRFDKKIVYSPNEPLAGAVTNDPNDERFFFIERSSGKVSVYYPSTRKTKTVQTLDVFDGLEDGLLGIAFDPDFILNQFIYLYYSPSPRAMNENRISRFTMNGDTFDLSTEVVVLSVPTQRNKCCHSGGHLNFGPDGNLWLTVGDNTNPFQSNGYAPIDERPGRSPYDAQKSASNTNDLRGKILRIKVHQNGTYTCPEGNLFTQDATHRCEIYVMGNRNPFRMSVNAFNPTTIYWGEVGPDAKEPGDRGPSGHDEVNKASSAGNYGWPYCLADNKAYTYYDFETELTGSTFNCSRPINDSPNNSGARVLPPAQSSFVWYSKNGFKSNEEAVPGSGGSTAMAPYFHQHDPSRFGECALPEYYNNSLFFVDWSRNKLVNYIMDSEGNLLHAVPLWQSFQFNKPIDVVKANDGSIYVLEYGNAQGTKAARISRMCYKNLQRIPGCLATASPTGGTIPLTVQFDALTDGSELAFEWDFESDGVVDSTIQSPQHTFTTPGSQLATVRVYDPTAPSTQSMCTVTVSVAGSSEPQITHLSPPLNGGIVDWGEEIVHQVAVYGGENNPMISEYDCPEVTLDSSLGHEDHKHGISQETGTCMATFTTLTADGHDDYNDWLFWDLTGSYRDPVTKKKIKKSVVLHPRMRQAEKFSRAKRGTCMATDKEARSFPVRRCTFRTQDEGGGLAVGWIAPDTWLRYDEYNPHNTESVTFRVSSTRKGDEVGVIEMKLDKKNRKGRVVARASIPGTGGLQNWVDVTVPLEEPNQIFEMDLGSERTVSAIILDSSGSPNEYARGYQVYVAGEDRSFGSPIQPVYRAEPNLDTSPAQRIILSPARTGVRHIRIMQTGDSEENWWSIHEALVLDENSQEIPIQSASASREGNDCEASNAIDGDPFTRWCTLENQNGGPYNIYLMFRQGKDSKSKRHMFNLNWFRFDGGQGVSRVVTG